MRTRFPPSPTGFLHIGGLRTALFSWLVAKQSKGTFFLRIEDTDQAREVEGATENFIRTLVWAGLNPDEGVVLDAAGHVAEKGNYGPYFQSKRLGLYKQHADQLLASGHAYRCFCTPERLDRMRKRQQEQKQAPMYDRTCLQLSKEEIDSRVKSGEPHVIRLLIPRDRTIAFRDEIYGKLEFKGAVIDDQVLMKSDGFPTYHLAHAVDDHLMKTDVVVRGEEWISSLPKHILLFEAFGWQPPKYAHVPLLLNKDRSKLSKRQNDVATEHYIQKGYLPEALVNFIALLGWNPGTEQEIFTIEELIKSFSIDRVQKSGAIFDITKLDWIQGQWMRKIPAEEFAERIRPLVAEKYSQANTDPGFAGKSALVQERVIFFPDAPEMIGFFYERPEISIDLIANPKQKVAAGDVPKILALLQETLEKIPDKDWSAQVVASALDPVIAASGFKKGQMLWPLRAVLTGRQFSPGAFEVAGELGKVETLARLDQAVLTLR